MTSARRQLINDNIIGTYHITSRCVRQAWLLNNKNDPDRDYSPRKRWIYDLIEKYIKAYCIDIGGYAIMENHFHLILRNRPDELEKLNNEERAERWLSIHPTKAAKREKRSKPNSTEIKTFLKNPINIQNCKERLSSISWFMWEIKQKIARRANKEDETKGTFWESRFNSQFLEGEADVLACMTYIDLNPIRAGVTNSIETSKFTSAHDRLHEETAKKNINVFKNKFKEKGTKPSYLQLEEYKDQHRIQRANKWLSSIQRNETAKTKPFLRMHLKDYFELLDYTGREIRSDKHGAIPEKVPHILEIMDINHEEWINHIKNYGKWYYRVLGNAIKIKQKLKDTKQKWFKGIKQNSKLYLSTSTTI